MSSQTKKLLENFASHANWRDVEHSEDVERFWDFVISAYRNGEHNISLDEFLDIVNTVLKSKGDAENTKFSEKKRYLTFKMVMFNKYEGGIRLLRKFDGK